MRRVGGLLVQIADRENLRLAFWKAARGRHDSRVVREFGQELEARLESMREKFLAGTGAAPTFSQFVVFDPKRWVIHAGPFGGRVRHHALMNVCSPVFEPGALDHSFARRTDWGTTAALARAQYCAGSFRWHLKLDIRQYFDSIHHQRLKVRFHWLFREVGLLAGFDRIVDGYATEPGCGLPIGTLTSQYWAYFHLDPLDRFVNEILKCPAYGRYLDDFALWSNSATELGDWLEKLRVLLDEELALELKSNERCLPTPEGMLFLGFRVLPNRILPGRRERRRFRRRWHKHNQAWREDRLTDSVLQERLTALVAHTLPAQCRNWRRRMLAELEPVEEAL